MQYQKRVIHGSLKYISNNIIWASIRIYSIPLMMRIFATNGNVVTKTFLAFQMNLLATPQTRTNDSQENYREVVVPKQGQMQRR